MQLSPFLLQVPACACLGKEGLYYLWWCVLQLLWRDE